SDVTAEVTGDRFHRMCDLNAYDPMYVDPRFAGMLWALLTTTGGPVAPHERSLGPRPRSGRRLRVPVIRTRRPSVCSATARQLFSSDDSGQDGRQSGAAGRRNGLARVFQGGQGASIHRPLL